MGDMIDRDAALAFVKDRIRHAMASDLSGAEFRRYEAEEIRAFIAALPAATVRVKPLVWEPMHDNAGMLQRVTSAWCGLFERRFYAERPKDQPRVEAKRAARILAALEPVPTAGQRLIAAATEAVAIARGETEPAAVYVPDAAIMEDVLLTVPDDIELYHTIKASGAKKRIDVARAVSAHLEPMRRAIHALLTEKPHDRA